MGTWCCHCTHLYKALPHLHTLIAFLEFICGITRLVLFFSPISSDNSSVQTASTPSKAQYYTAKYVAAFAIDWISSIVPTLTGFFVAVLALVVLFNLLVYLCDSDSNNQVHPLENMDRTGWFRKVWNNKALRRVIALDCNCPCYKPRPKLRFQVRLIFLIIVVILRLVAISLYASSKNDNNAGSKLASLAAFTFILIFLTLLLDFYHYCVWWHYTPYLDTTCCCCRSRQHTRYLPYILVGDYRTNENWGDQTCPYNPCPNRRLEHIATFHSSRYQPQVRWTDLPKPEIPSDPKQKAKHEPTYIGFHTTRSDAAVRIAKGGFLPSAGGMLGPGVYFARSLEATIGKVGASGGKGAWIIAEIRMGNVYVTHRNAIPDFVRNGHWHQQYDTCYCVHPDDNLDEFCIKDPQKQIVRWVIVIQEEYDPKVKELGLDTEFDSTEYGCF